jgi:hypothetical protein
MYNKFIYLKFMLYTLMHISKFKNIYIHKSNLKQNLSKLNN